MNTAANRLGEFAPETFHFYRHAIEILGDAGVPFLVGGAYAFAHYTGIARHTKDFDVFIHRDDVGRTLAAFKAAGYRADLVFEHWLAKAYHGDDFVDIIFSSGNGLCPVDANWFRHALHGAVLDAEVRLIPAEEMIWQKAFIMERERFDGADVNHLLRARGRELEWDRLLERFGASWRVLLSHLILFEFVYPEDQDAIPERVRRALLARLAERPSARRNASLFCRGPLLSRTQYLTDTEEWGYADPRLAPGGTMTEEQLTSWTDAGR